MTDRGRIGAGALLLAAGLALGSAGGAADAPLTDEDIVRGFVSGRSASQLIEMIQTSEVDFDVSPEMLHELQAAGLPEAVIEAMKGAMKVAMNRRQAEIETAEPPTKVADPDDPSGSFPVLLNPHRPDKHEGPGKPRSKSEKRKGLRFLNLVPTALAETLNLAAEDRRFTDAAIFLGCTRSRHVPDHWRSKTPLGRDFVNTPRHRLLAWVSGARTMDRSRMGKFLSNLVAGPETADAAVLELDIPEQLEATPHPDETHDLILGVALEAGGRFYLITADVWDGAKIDMATGLSATLKGGASPLAPTAEVRFRHDAAPPRDGAGIPER